MNSLENTPEITLEAAIPNVRAVTAWIDEKLDQLDCPLKARMQLDVAIDELFSNIARYAYPRGDGRATVRFSCEGRVVSITFIDRGVPFNPLKRGDPDVSLPASARPLGGLGIFLVRKTMDGIEYRHESGQNILTIRKKI